MTEIKCPLCNAQLRPIGGFWDCPNDHREWAGTKELWQELNAATNRAERWEQFADDAKKHIDGLNNMIDSWCKLILGDLPNKHSILKEAITTYCYERRQKSTYKGE